MEKINFQNNVTKVNADTFNTFQDNIENGINAAVKTNINLNEEIETNEYISGKRIYVKKITTNASANTDTWEDINLKLTGNFTIQRVNGTVKHLNYKYYLPYFEAANVYFNLTVYQDSILKEKHGAVFNSAALDILVYYTKN